MDYFAGIDVSLELSSVCMDLLQENGEGPLKQEDLHAPDTLYERVPG
jgi:hypothetical protein